MKLLQELLQLNEIVRGVAIGRDGAREMVRPKSQAERNAIAKALVAQRKDNRAELDDLKHTDLPDKEELARARQQTHGRSSGSKLETDVHGVDRETGKGVNMTSGDRAERYWNAGAVDVKTAREKGQLMKSSHRDGKGK